MHDFAQMGTMDIWYAHLSEQDLLSAVNTATRALKRTDKNVAKGANTRAQKIAEKVRTRDGLHALSKLAQRVDGKVVGVGSVGTRTYIVTFTEAIRSGRLNALEGV